MIHTSLYSPATLYFRPPTEVDEQWAKVPANSQALRDSVSSSKGALGTESGKFWGKSQYTEETRKKEGTDPSSCSC